MPAPTQHTYYFTLHSTRSVSLNWDLNFFVQRGATFYFRLKRPLKTSAESVNLNFRRKVMKQSRKKVASWAAVEKRMEQIVRQGRSKHQTSLFKENIANWANWSPTLGWCHNIWFVYGFQSGTSNVYYLCGLDSTQSVNNLEVGKDA